MTRRRCIKITEISKSPFSALACLASSSPLIGLDLRTAAAHPLLDHTALWGRRFGHTSSSDLRSSSSGASLLGAAGEPAHSSSAPASLSRSHCISHNSTASVSVTMDDVALRTGDTLLLEADELAVRGNFSIRYSMDFEQYYNFRPLESSSLLTRRPASASAQQLRHGDQVRAAPSMWIHR